MPQKAVHHFNVAEPVCDTVHASFRTSMVPQSPVAVVGKFGPCAYKVEQYWPPAAATETAPVVVVVAVVPCGVTYTPGTTLVVVVVGAPATTTVFWPATVAVVVAGLEA